MVPNIRTAASMPPPSSGNGMAITTHRTTAIAMSRLIEMFTRGGGMATEAGLSVGVHYWG